ncbi:AEC family transporter [Cellulomonas endophytica]|uniref:AEC family transporter n=1 Tax=Cellulomonas endophytica TaxID=2494735 RepID=UPI0010101BCA|nr:AEC family transporter [Cellulomonas endophytica]
MSAVLQALGVLGAVIAAGAVLGRRGTLGPHAPAVLSRAVFTVATPALMLTTVAHADLHVLLSRATVATWGSTGLVALAGALVLRLVLRRPAAETVVGTLSASYLNAANLGLPLAVYLLGSPLAVVPTMLFQLLVLAPLSFAVLDEAQARADRRRPAPVLETVGGRTTGVTGARGTATATSTPGAAAAGADAPAGAPRPRAGAVLRRTLSNPVSLGALTGLVLAALPWRLPEVVLEPFALVGAAAAPLALLNFGLSLGARRVAGDRAPRADLALVVGLRLLHPLVAAGLATLVGLEGPARLAVVAMAALPTAQNVLVYAVQYGRGQPVARDAGLLTTLLAVPLLLVVTTLLS